MLDRQREKVISNASGSILGEYYYYRKAGDHATGQISTYVVKNGTKIFYTYKGKLITGYIRFLGHNGGANYAFVGMHGTKAATFGIRSVSELIRVGIPWLAI